MGGGLPVLRDRRPTRQHSAGRMEPDDSESSRRAAAIGRASPASAASGRSGEARCYRPDAHFPASVPWQAREPAMRGDWSRLPYSPELKFFDDWKLQKVVLPRYLLELIPLRACFPAKSHLPALSSNDISKVTTAQILQACGARYA